MDDYEYGLEEDQIWIDFKNKNWNSPTLIQYELNPDGVEKKMIPVFLFVSCFSNKPLWFTHLVSRYGEEVPSMDEFVLTPLHVSIRLNHAPLFLFFLSELDINIQDQKGKTPLHVALELNRSDMVQYLLLKKASSHAVDVDGKTTLNYAVLSRNIHLVKIFVKFYNPEHNPVIDAIRLNSYDIIELLISSHNKMLHGSLKVAIQERNVKMVSYLIELGAKPTDDDYYEELIQFRNKNDENIHDEMIEMLL